LKDVFFTSPFVPREWIAAHGLYPREFPARCHSSPRAVMGGCPFAQAFLQTTGENAAVFATGCDQMRRAADEAAGDHVFLLNIPATWQSPAARQLYREEIERLGRFLVRMGGRAPTREELAGQLLECGTPVPLSCRRSSAISGTTGCAQNGGGPPIRKRHGGAALQNIPLALVGELPLFSFVDRIENAGGYLALDATKRTPLFNKAQIEKDPFTALVDGYFDNVVDVFQRPDSRLYDWLRPRVKGIRGIILWHYAWCDLWRASAERIREALQLPLLHLDAGDATSFTTGMQTRLEAFLETLRA